MCTQFHFVEVLSTYIGKPLYIYIYVLAWKLQAQRGNDSTENDLHDARVARLARPKLHTAGKLFTSIQMSMDLAQAESVHPGGVAIRRACYDVIMRSVVPAPVATVRLPNLLTFPDQVSKGRDLMR